MALWAKMISLLQHDRVRSFLSYRGFTKSAFTDADGNPFFAGATLKDSSCHSEILPRLKVEGEAGGLLSQLEELE